MSTEKFSLLHTMIRVLDLDKSIDFYTRHLGMKVLRRTDYPEGKFTNVFVGDGDEATSTVLELTHNWDQDLPYDLGSAVGQVHGAAPEIYAAGEAMEQERHKIAPKPGPMKHGTTVIAFIEDPDGYKIELIERK